MQQGITLIEVVIATLMSSLVFVLVISLSNKVLSVYQIQQTHLLRQIALTGALDLTKSLQRASAPYVTSISTPSFTAVLPYSVNNNIVLTSNAYEVEFPLNADVVSSAGTGPSNVDKPSDQMVIQYTVDEVGTKDCEGGLIAPYASTKQTVIEKYFVRKSIDSKTLVLACTSGRYSTTAGFSDMSGIGRVVVPNVDYFHFMLVSVDSDHPVPNPSPSATLLPEWHNLSTFLSLPVPVNPFGRQVIGVEFGIIMHTPLPSGIKPPLAQPTSLVIMDETVSLNNPATIGTAVYDVVIQPKLMGY